MAPLRPGAIVAIVRVVAPLRVECQNPPLGIVPPLGYLLNDAPGSPMSPPRGPMGGGAFLVAWRGTVYVTPGPYLPIAKGLTFIPIF